MIKLDGIIDKASKLKIPLVAIFPHTPNKKKNNLGSEALNEDNLVCKAIRKIKKNNPDIGVMADVALDPYTSHGHDGILKNNEIINDETIKILAKQALLQARMGCDVIAPSDMMDGRVGIIRKILDKNNLNIFKFYHTQQNTRHIFMDHLENAIGSKKKLKEIRRVIKWIIKIHLKLLREVALDIKEGADFVMVKPAMPYLDVIKSVKDTFKVPVFAYQVSGEYSMIAQGIKDGYLNKEAIIESLIAIKRAGSSAIVTYFAMEVAKKLKKNL